MTTMTTGQRKIFAAQRDAERRHWQSLRGAVPVELQPAPASVIRGDHDEQHRVEVPEPAATAILRACRDDDDALEVYLLAAMVALESRYAGEGHFAVGLEAPTSVVAPFLAVASRVDASTQWADLVRSVAASRALASTNADFPVDIVLAPPTTVLVRGDSSGPYEPAPAVRVSVLRHGSSIELGISTSRPGGATVLRHLVALLESAARSPQLPVLDLDLLGPADREVIDAANDAEHPFDAGASLCDLIDADVARAGSTAIVGEGFAHLFAELTRRRRDLVGRLVRAGVGPGDRVGICLDRGPHLIPAVTAVLELGAAYVPVDTRLPQARIDYLLEDAAVSAVLVEIGTRARVSQQLRCVVVDGPDAGGTPPAVPAGAVGAPRPTPEHAAYVIYTSGSTGRPKGVVVEHRSVVNRLQWMQAAYPLAEDDVILQKTPLSFDVSVWELLWWQLGSGSLCMLSPGAERDPEQIAAAIERHQVTVMHFVPTMLAAFLRYVEVAGLRGSLASLRRIFVSGEALAPEHARSCRELLPQVDLVNLYGPTEATVDVSHHRCVGDEDPVPIGLPIWNTSLHVLDARQRPCPVGMAGELWIGGVGVARGYLGRVKLTAERFRDDVLGNGAVLYRTGDTVVRRADGVIDYIGRDDGQIKVRGIRIELGEVESALRECPGVDDAAVVARTRDDQTALIGYVVGGNPDRVRRHLLTLLPEAVVPEAIVVLDLLPLSPNGKLDRTALPDIHATTQPGSTEPPEGPVEEAVAAVVAEVLGIDAVGRNDRLLSLGANSIHFITIMSALRKRGLHVSFQGLFEAEDVAALAGTVEELGASTEGKAIPAFELVPEAERHLLPKGVVDAYPMTFLQAGTLFQSEMTRGSAQYHDIISYVVDGLFDAEAFREALDVLVARHAIFRTSYDLTSFSDYMQLVHEKPGTTPYFVEDLRHLDVAAQEQWHRDWEDHEKHHDFDWSSPGFVRLHVHLLSDDRYRYSISQHNSSLDGWSINQLHVQLFTIYTELLRGGTLEQAPNANHLRQFVALEKDAAASVEAREYFARVLTGRPDTRIPRLGRTAHSAYDVEMRDVSIDGELSRRIIDLAAREKVAVKTVLLAAHCAALGLVTNQDEILTGYEYGGRPEVEGAERALGLFLNSIPFRVVTGDRTWAELVADVRRLEGDFLPHRRYPMARMKSDLRTQDALFETVFNFTHFHSLKELRSLGPAFESTMDATSVAITEFPFRAEFARHHYRDAVQLSLHFHTHQFDHDQIDDIAGVYRRVLEAMTADVSSSITDVAADFSWITTPASSAGEEPDGAPALAVPPADWVPERSHPLVVRIACEWSRVLGIPEADIGLDDDFFELGGSSLPAMKVAVAFDGVLTIRDLMVNSRLGEAATVAIARTGTTAGDQTLLGELVTSDAPAATVVCFPYGAGHGVHFRALAAAIRERDERVAVLAVDLPGHEASSSPGELFPVGDIARLVVQELVRRESGPVVLWGHCIGSALAVAVGDELTRIGAPPQHIFLAGKILYTDEEMRESIEHVSAMTYDDIVGWLRTESGFSGAEDLGPDYAETLVRTFRHDSTSANEFLIARAATDDRLSVPTTCVLVEDDPITTGMEDRAADWERICADVSVEVLEVGGGHYFATSRPDAVADVVVGVTRGIGTVSS